jgi:hypothetical protein
MTSALTTREVSMTACRSGVTVTGANAMAPALARTTPAVKV